MKSSCYQYPKATGTAPKPTPDHFTHQRMKALGLTPRQLAERGWVQRILRFFVRNREAK